MSATVFLPILNLSATNFREAPGLSKISILVDNVIEVLPGMVDGGNILKPFALTHASCRQNERVL